MTKKNYELIANTIKESIEFYTEWGGNDNEKARAKTAVQRTANQLARAFEKENPRFDREKFLKACGIN